MAGDNISAKAQAALGLPDGFKTYGPFPFGGMDTSASALAIADQDFTWRENFIRLGDGSLRTAWDIGTPIYTAAGNSIVYFCFYTIGLNYYVAVFFSDGSALQINTVSLAQTTIATSGFYTNSGLLPFARQWGTQYLLICNRNTTNDYWIWDGAILYKAGTAAPNGVLLTSTGFNYSSMPSITVYGGSGSGMAITPVVSNGGVVQMTITNPGTGYQIGDQPQVAFSGGGSDTGAILTSSLASGGVGSVIVSAGGSGYTSASVNFSGGGGGSGANGNVQISTGVTAVSLTSGGSGYTYAYITFSGGGGTGAAGVCNIVSGAISSITITSPGFGYTSAPTATITGSGIGVVVNTVTITTGVIVGVQITNPGSGYTSAPNVNFSGTGAGASGSSLLAPSGVASVAVVNGGSGYTSVPTVSFVGGGGAGATGIVNLTATSIASINLTAGGSGYTSPPTVTFQGGSGSGAAGIPVMVGDTVGAIVLSNSGSGYTGPVQVVISGGGGSGAGATVLFKPTSIASVTISSVGQYYTTAPAVQLSAGANNAASATVALMPYGVSGSAMETFLSRVWLVNPAASAYSTVPPGGQFQYSGPGSVTNFSTSAGGGNATNTDSFLQTQYTGVRQSSGYLYFFGDGSVSVASNVSTSGSPTVTTYNYQNVDPQAGLSWRDTLQDFGRSTIMGNATGFYGLYGGAATKISGKMDGVFLKASFPPYVGAITPSGAIATIFNVKHYLGLMTVTDPDTGAARNVMLTWDEKTWSVTSQSVSLTFIGSQKISSAYTVWGTDGTSLYPLFSKPSSTLSSRLDTKNYGGDRVFLLKELLSTWVAASDQSVGSVGVNGTITGVFSGAPALGITNATSGGSALWTQPLVLSSPAPYFGVWGTASVGGIPFTSMSLRLTTTSPDFVLGNWVIGYKEAVAIF